MQRHKPAHPRTLERAFLFGHIAGTPSRELPPPPVLRYYDHPREDIRAAFWRGYAEAERQSRWFGNACHEFSEEAGREAATKAAFERFWFCCKNFQS